jgi:Transposase DDE domain
MTTLPLFCDVDDFCTAFAPVWQQVLLTAQPKQRNRKFGLCLSEVMTIIIQFHLSGYRTFKDYYTKEVLVHQRGEFPGLVSYNRFVELLPAAFVPLCVYLHTRFGECSGISFIDSTKLAVCHNRRIWGHKVFADLAQRGKSSVDWFYGFKLHLIVNDCGELLNVTITAGNVDDRAVVPDLVKDLFGKLFGDKGYISQPLFEQLFTDGVQLITKLKKGMKERLMSQFDKLLLRKRGISETVNDQLKNISQIEHTRHRSVYNFFVNLIAGLVAYTFREKKPSLHLRDRHLLPAVL